MQECCIYSFVPSADQSNNRGFAGFYLPKYTEAAIRGLKRKYHELRNNTMSLSFSVSGDRGGFFCAILRPEQFNPMPLFSLQMDQEIQMSFMQEQADVLTDFFVAFSRPANWKVKFEERELDDFLLIMAGLFLETIATSSVFARVATPDILNELRGTGFPVASRVLWNNETFRGGLRSCSENPSPLSYLAKALIAFFRRLPNERLFLKYLEPPGRRPRQFASLYAPMMYSLKILLLLVCSYPTLPQWLNLSELVWHAYRLQFLEDEDLDQEPELNKYLFRAASQRFQGRSIHRNPPPAGGSGGRFIGF